MPGVSGSFDIKGVQNGEQNITMTVNYDTGYSQTITKTIMVGSQIEGDIYYNNYATPLSTNNYINSTSCTVNIIPNGMANINWSKQYGDASYSVSNQGKQINISNLGYISLSASGTTSCGYLSKSFLFYNSNNYYRVAPNPVKNKLVITAEVSRFKGDLSNNGRSTLDLSKITPRIDNVSIFPTTTSRMAPKQYFYAKGTEEVQISVEDLEKGSYTVLISSDKRVITKSFIKM
mgnify:CR=1 FL=1